MDFDLLHPAEQLVMIMERIYAYGMTTTSGGNLSILEENGDLWITPGGVDKGSLTPRDVMRVRPGGAVEGIHKPSVELPFHQQIYAARPELRAIVHAHPPALVAFSIVRRLPDTSLVPNARIVCGEVGLAPYGLPGSADLGAKIAAVFARGCDSVLLENHGAVVGGEDLFRAFMAFETLDFCARLELGAVRIGAPRGLSEEQIALSRHKQHVQMPELPPRPASSEERSLRRELCQLVRRACDQLLFTSTQGTFSQRLPEGGFIITPYGFDRRYLAEKDLVRVEGGAHEAGKLPSRSVVLHEAIYARHPHVRSVIVAHPPAIMAFAVTGEAFDSRTIPESYILLRKVEKLPFGCTFMDPQGTAAAFTAERPLALVENDCVIVTGSSLLNAFDRLEVAEYSAKALLASRALGKLVPIDAAQVAEIDAAFLS